MPHCRWIRYKIYCSCVWKPSSVTHIKKIVQKRFIHVLGYKKRIFYRRDCYNYLCTQFNLTTIKVWNMMFNICFLHKVFQNHVNCPLILSSFNLKVPVRKTRQITAFSGPKCRIILWKHSFVPHVLKLVNSQPPPEFQVFQTTSPNAFKNKIIKYLVNVDIQYYFYLYFF